MTSKFLNSLDKFDIGLTPPKRTLATPPVERFLGAVNDLFATTQLKGKK